MTRSSIANSLDAMKAAVKQGRFGEASLIGTSADIPLAIPAADLMYGKLLHAGPHSTVHQGAWDGQQVAIKRVFIRTSADLDSFRQEVCLMAAAEHSYVVRLLGARALPPDYIMVMPLEPDNAATKLHEAGWRPGAATVISLAAQLAQALQHIHSQGVVHRDLKPSNVLLDSTGGLKVTDFGIAELANVLLEENAERSSLVGVGKPSGGFHKRHMVGTLEYMAPEVLLKEPGSFPSDVYAFAVTVNELVTGTFPFSDCTTDNPKAHTVLEMGYGRQELAAAVVGEGLRPLAGESTPEALQGLLDACWQREPSSRPTASQIVAALTQMQECGDAAPPDVSSAPAALPVAFTDYGLETTSASSGVTSTSSAESDGLWVLPAPPAYPSASSYSPQLSVGAFATAGLRGEDKMEDRHVIAEQLGGISAMSLLAVFDGHRGAATAEYAATNVVPALRRNWDAHDPAAILSRTFITLDADFRQAEAAEYTARVQRMGEGNAGPRSWPGCTAIAALLQGDQLWVANAGDCRAVLCREGLAVAASRDHNADDEEERGRVVAAGAQVALRMGNWRVGLAGIQVTRSLGDGDLKEVGLTAEPEVLPFRLSDSDEFLILASDGLWDGMSNQEAIQIVHDTVKQPAMCAQRLATEALTRGSRDNITVIVAFLRPVETIERIYGAGKHKFAVAVTHYGSRG